jgi:hypothetical protein
LLRFCSSLLDFLNQYGCSCVSCTGTTSICFPETSYMLECLLIVSPANHHTYHLWPVMVLISIRAFMMVSPYAMLLNKYQFGLFDRGVNSSNYIGRHLLPIKGARILGQAKDRYPPSSSAISITKYISCRFSFYN